MTQPTQTPATSPEAPAGEARRWRGHTHEELYRLLHEGPGAAASAEPSRRWQEIATNLDEIGQDLRKALEQSGAGWAGQAAGRAYDRLSVTATWAAETSTAAADMRVAVENQGDHIAKARADMPVPEDVPAAEPDPAVAPAVQVAQTQNDLEGPEAAASSAEERAFEVMAAYELNSETTTAALATFTEPPALVERHDMHRGGGIEHHEARPSGLLGWLRPHRREHHRP
ncbi:MAG TPA: PPE domain-containing protein, partial [Actinophytocola sp.]|nr:PPE domain-containing protein [Actinophytocola sp.]